jgi:SAM-dependent methyltransferase
MAETYSPPEDLKARLAASYDALAPEYNKWTLGNDNPRVAWLSKLLSKLPQSAASDSSTSSPPQILELGAGAGIPTTKAILDHDQYVQVHANDISAGQLDLLRKNLAGYTDRLHVHHGDMLSINLEPASLDAVVGMYSIIHLPQDEQVQLLEKISTWLRPGGVFLANFSQQEAKETVAEEWLKVDKAWVYWASLGEKGSIDAVKKAGLEILENAVSDGKGVDADFVWILARKPTR